MPGYQLAGTSGYIPIARSLQRLKHRRDLQGQTVTDSVHLDIRTRARCKIRGRDIADSVVEGSTGLLVEVVLHTERKSLPDRLEAAGRVAGIIRQP